MGKGVGAERGGRRSHRRQGRARFPREARAPWGPTPRSARPGGCGVQGGPSGGWGARAHVHVYRRGRGHTGHTRVHAHARMRPGQRRRDTRVPMGAPRRPHATRHRGRGRLGAALSRRSSQARGGAREHGAPRGGRSRADGPAACGGSEAAPRERCHRVAAHGITEGTASHAEPTARVTKGGTFTRPQSASSRKCPLTFEGDGQGRRSRCRAPAGTGSMMGALHGQCWGKAQPPAVQQDAGGGAISSATRLPTRHSRECAPEVPSGTLLRAPATS